MVKFSELTINTSPMKELIIKAAVFNTSSYTNVYIKNVYVLKYTDFNPSNISGCLTKAAYIKTYTQGEAIKSINLSLSELNLMRDVYSIDLEKDMVFVVIDCYGTPTGALTCGSDNIYSVGVTFNVYKYYGLIMNYIKELDNSCNIPMGLISKFLEFEALKAAIITNNYLAVITLYTKFFNNIIQTTTQACNCYG